MDISEVIALHADDLEFVKVDDILDDLWEKNILPDAECFAARETESPAQRWLHLQEWLARGDDSAFCGFLECLRERGHESLADRMIAERNEPPSSLDGLFLSNWNFLRSHLDVDRVANKLYDSGVLSSEDVDEIMASPDLGDQRIIFLTKILAVIEPKTFDKFLKALEEAGQSFISSKLQAQWDATDAGDSDRASILLSKIPSENEIWEIAGKLSKAWARWEDLGKELGLDHDVLQRVQRMSRTAFRSTYLLLSEWRKLSCASKHSFFRALCEALSKLGMKLEAEKIVDFICKKSHDDNRKDLDFWIKDIFNSASSDEAIKTVSSEEVLMTPSEKIERMPYLHEAVPRKESGTPQTSSDRSSCVAHSSTHVNRRLKICILGVTGTGKSTLGNVLLGFEHDDGEHGFDTSSRVGSSTISVRAMDGFWLGDENRPIRIIDAPGHGDASGRDLQFRQELVEKLREEGHVDAFIWVKNSQHPRFDKQEAQHLDLLRRMFGGGFFQNMVVVFSRWSFSAEAERRRSRHRQPIKLEDVKKDFLTSLFLPHTGYENQDTIPMMAVDAFYDVLDERENAAFEEETMNLWQEISRCSSTPVDNIEVAYEKIEQMENEAEELKKTVDRMEKELLVMQKKNAKLKKQKRELKMHQEAEHRKQVEVFRKRLEESMSKVQREKERLKGPSWVKIIQHLGEELDLGNALNWSWEILIKRFFEFWSRD
ncbi:unnamed protein product [Darwinula stevensoni]|uniref:Uncharacterized protein n=1 Tax=Darwinula stevensoni TaxID=69355 RepID=A0A7R9A7L0_9CRUS|nr:unnamed protein product [Darwinula stevensoni]CAG0892348.1 unnamed protein product [Darwinula stevensoni]